MRGPGLVVSGGSRLPLDGNEQELGRTDESTTGHSVVRTTDCQYQCHYCQLATREMHRSCAAAAGSCLRLLEPRLSHDEANSRRRDQIQRERTTSGLDGMMSADGRCALIVNVRRQR